MIEVFLPVVHKHAHSEIKRPNMNKASNFGKYNFKGAWQKIEEIQ